MHATGRRNSGSSSGIASDPYARDFRAYSSDNGKQRAWYNSVDSSVSGSSSSERSRSASAGLMYPNPNQPSSVLGLMGMPDPNARAFVPKIGNSK